jgi:bifunctional DNA-binding transcriptional regulator/antitoxin component of YhaV-PrlF toxin-antitoxin module
MQNLELTVTAKGQVTLKRSVLHHLGIRPGQKVSVSLLPGRRVSLEPASAKHDIREFFGALSRPGRRPVSLKQMQKAIESVKP